MASHMPFFFGLKSRTMKEITYFSSTSKNIYRRQAEMSESDDNLLVMEDINKAFPGVQALENVSLTLKRGEILCLVGETARGSPP